VATVTPATPVHVEDSPERRGERPTDAEVAPQTLAVRQGQAMLADQMDQMVPELMAEAVVGALGTAVAAVAGAVEADDTDLVVALVMESGVVVDLEARENGAATWGELAVAAISEETGCRCPPASRTCTTDTRSGSSGDFQVGTSCCST